MKDMRLIPVTVCDVCGKLHIYSSECETCYNCGKDFCVEGVCAEDSGELYYLDEDRIWEVNFSDARGICAGKEVYICNDCLRP